MALTIRLSVPNPLSTGAYAFLIAVTTWRLVYSRVSRLKSPPHVMIVIDSFGVAETIVSQGALLAGTGWFVATAYLNDWPPRTISISSPTRRRLRSQSTAWHGGGTL